jgi:hypothetical protein
VSARGNSFIAVVEFRILSHWEITFVVLGVVKYTMNVRSDKPFELPVVFSVPAGKYQDRRPSSTQAVLSSSLFTDRIKFRSCIV